MTKTSKFFLKLKPNTTDLYKSSDYFIEVWANEYKYAIFGGSYSDSKEKICTIIAKNLNTIDVCKIESIEEADGLQETNIDLKLIQELQETGVKHNLVKFK